MKQQFEIKIPKPCSAEWTNMTPNKNGKHCDSCNKTVIDFTKMSDNEIVSYFTANSSRKTCGYFYKGQLKVKKNTLQSYLYNSYCDSYAQIQNKTRRLFILFILGIALTVVGCQTPTLEELNERKETLIGDSTAIPIIDTTKMDTSKFDTIKNGL